MHQQAVCEQNQIGNQQMAQQMVLCPVRVVYETQILVQPGDQIQPNQTIFLNTQNQPPWAHNRQIQNQVIYVPNVAHNIMSSIPQHMEQNHMYIQHPYQQIMHQQMLAPTASSQENIRPYHIPNVVPQNIMQNIQTNVGPNMPSQVTQRTEGVGDQTQYAPVQSNIGPTVPISQNNSALDRQNSINNQAMATQNVLYNQRSMYVNIGQQQNQQVVARPQLITINPMQQTRPNIQTFDQTSQTQNVPKQTQMVPQMYTNISNPMTRIRKPSSVNPISNTRNVAPSYIYRPIQPRPQFRASVPNIQPMVQTAASNVNQNISQKPQQQLQQHSLKSPSILEPNNDSTKLNRKRKSESPTDINNKLTIININTPLPQTSVNNNVKSIEIGVNTSPVHYAQNRDITKIAAPKDNSCNVSKLEDSKTSDKEREEKEKDDFKNSAVEKDNFVRYTVFPQARVRSSKDDFNKVNVNILKDTKNILLNDENEKKCDNKIETSKTLLKEKLLNKFEEKCKLTEIAPKEDNKIIEETDKQDKNYVLTHVLDGIVIQESNLAFPIRDPATKIAQPSNIPEKKREVVKVDAILKNNCLQLPLADMEMKDEIDNLDSNNDNPFRNLKSSMVKTWTVDQLSSFLSNHQWEDTVSLLREHEIDGETLFMVTKQQLLQIGVSEKHADVICEYVKS